MNATGVDSATTTVDGRISTFRTVGDAFRTVVAFPRQFILVGAATGAPLFVAVSAAAFFETSPVTPELDAFTSAVTAVGFTCLCAMALQVLRGDEARLPQTKDILRIAPAALVLGAIGGLALWTAVWGPLSVIMPFVVEVFDIEEPDFFSGEWLLAGGFVLVVTLFFALPISFALAFFLVLPSLSLSLPAVADGRGILRALTLSFGRGMRNFGAMFGLSLIYSLILVLISTAADALSASLFGGAPFLAAGVSAVFAIVVASVYGPWLAALLSSAYLQTTGGSSGSGAERS